MKINEFKHKDTHAIAHECLDYAKRANEELNAVVTFCEVDAQVAALQDKEQNAHFYGTPIIVKDNILTKGIRTTASSRILDNYIPIYDATVVKKLQAAGAILIGKSSMDELGMGGTNLNAYTGKVNNPYDYERISGGSSGGSAALVAANVVPMALGTDTGDSIRKPAAYCGVVGLKPTYGRVSRYGVIPYASSLDHVGCFTRNVYDAALTLETIAGRDDHDMTTSYEPVPAYAEDLNCEMKGKRIAVFENVLEAVEDPKIKEMSLELLEKMKAQGAIVEYIRMDETLMKTMLPTYFIIANAEATSNHSNLDGIRYGMRERGDEVEEVMTSSRTLGFSSEVRKRFVIGSYALFEENQDRLLRKAQKVRRLLVAELAKALEGYDVLFAPAAGSVAPHVDDCHEDKLSSTYLIAENHMLLGNFSGYPSITIPMGYIDGLPVAVNLTAKAFQEQTLLNVACAMEHVTGLADACKEVI
ncbi:MAG: amidase family protein [Erysipelotrichaceae bacterium]